MNRHYLFVASQVRELEDLLAATPEEDILDRMSLEARLKTVKKELDTISHHREDGINESTQSFRGEFQGVLPAARRFEFKMHNQNKLIHGVINTSIRDPDIVNREWLHKPAKIMLKVTKVGQGYPDFMLVSLDDISPDELSAC